METKDSSSQVFLGDLYHEAMSLLVEVRDHMADRRSKGDDGNLEPAGRLEIRSEAFRVTTRLSQVMAWLLMQKAVHAGEMNQRDAMSTHNRLSGHPASPENHIPSGEILSPDLRRLRKRSNDLYARVARLDEMAANCRHIPGSTKQG